MKGLHKVEYISDDESFDFKALCQTNDHIQWKCISSITITRHTDNLRNIR